MTAVERISAVILTYNEEELIRTCLSKLAWADEVLVVDSFSTDRTVELARAAGARVLQNPFGGFASQTNWAFSRASGDWFLQIDADEFVTPELRDAVQATVRNGGPLDLYALKRDSSVFGRRLRSSAWSGEWVPRLFRKGHIEFTGEVHPDPQINGRPLGRLAGRLIHYPYRDTKKYFEKFQSYSTLWAEKARSLGRRTSVPLACGSALWRSFHDYFIRGGVLDGRIGFVLALLAGMHTFIRHIKLWGMQNADAFGRVHETEGFPDAGGENDNAAR